jgi:putative photosynthetic complex assembly protein 2
MALQALLYHELMIVFWAGLIVMLTWRAPNQIGTFAFLILMAMRISAKLNIFLGVPNLTDEFLPQRLVYLKSYFRKGQISSLFPATVGAAALVAIFLAQKALGASGAEASGFALLFSLIALAILEHLFMVFPIPDAVLWRWAFPAPKQGEKNWP